MPATLASTSASTSRGNAGRSESHDRTGVVGLRYSVVGHGPSSKADSPLGGADRRFIGGLAPRLQTSGTCCLDRLREP